MLPRTKTAHKTVAMPRHGLNHAAAVFSPVESLAQGGDVDKKIHLSPGAFLGYLILSSALAVCGVVAMLVAFVLE
jgi:hypothetical protein